MFLQAVILHVRLAMVPRFLPVLHVLTTSFSVDHIVLVCAQEEHMLKKGSVYLAMSRAPIAWGKDTEGSYISSGLDI